MSVLNVAPGGGSAEEIHDLSVGLRELEQQHTQLSEYVKYVSNVWNDTYLLASLG